jgi:radical SAM superfamily enzyme YgiQ (UPF0313 family)
VTPATRDILLVAVNARYSHCAYASRSLQANLGRLADSAALLEADLDVSPLQLAEQITGRHPRIVGFSVYLWNVRLVEATARILRAVAPQIRLVAGGPELTLKYANTALFDAVIVGEGETAFRNLCERWLTAGRHTTETPNAQRSTLNAQHSSPSDSLSASPSLIMADPEDPDALVLPYDLYTDADLAQRTVYVEASRGCPYACTYCTSAGTGLRVIPLDRLLPALNRLWLRGLQRFKFLDRSFNAPVAHAAALLDFFLARATPDTSLHFEINTDHLHETIAARIAAFPKGVLHLEAGVQTLNPRVAAAIGRSEDSGRTLANLNFLALETGAVVHADLIFGLPGEDEASFACGFNTLVAACHPPEVQVNLLKVLPGTRLAHDADSLGLVFNAEPPYELLRSGALDFAALMRLQRFARCWELVHNRGRFPNAVRAIHAACNGDYYGTYQTLATRIQAEEGKLFAIGLPRLSRLLYAHLTEACGISPSDAEAHIAVDLNGKKS